MTDAELLKLLHAIYQLALVPYPFEDDGKQRDPGMVLALGEIAGIASRVIARKQKELEALAVGELEA